MDDPVNPTRMEKIMDIVTYLGFDGQCEAAFKHYEKVLGGKILMMMRMADAPAGTPMPTDAADRIMHARLQVGDRLLMGGDAPAGRASKPQGFCANIMVDDPAVAERIFRELGEGGTVTMPIAETFWARKFGMLTDKFGVPWMVNCEKAMVATEPASKPDVAMA
jgi:PhnB protein